MVDKNSELKNNIREIALKIGFEEVGFAKVDTLTNEIEHYKQWISGGYHSTMGWMERNIDKRESVDLILEGAKSVIVLAHSYYNGNNVSQHELSSKVARYAWGEDYHDIILNKLKSLELAIKEKQANIKTKSYVDTGPILEKQWAIRAGIGWQGKNSLVLSKNLGSYFFIGVIISDLEFDSDEEVKDYCRSCTKCIDACPTEAIIVDKVVDSNKCISFWTIEAKPDKEIPKSIAENLNNWIFGCDICQEVCPWNKHKPKITSELHFSPNPTIINLNMSFLENMSEEEFKQNFAKSPIKRTKLLGLKRNVRALKGYSE